MDAFEYRDGELLCESVRCADVAAALGTPTYLYSAATITDHYTRLARAFECVGATVCFAVKSCPNLSVLRLLAALGSGMDVVSLGELHRARLAGVPPRRIVFAGVGKTDEEISAALAGSPSSPGPIARFNVESEQELEAIGSIARSMGVVARAAIRVNPAVDAGAHDYVSTGRADTKFGLPIPAAATILRRFARDRHVCLDGVHVHTGSSITDVAAYAEAVRRVVSLIDDVSRDAVPIRCLDIGGGFAADYTTGHAPRFDDYAQAVRPILAERVAAGLQVVIEPGRAIVANAGVLLSRVLFVKVGGRKKFVVLDAGMHTLLRPALYDAFHFIWPVSVSERHVPSRRELNPAMEGLEVVDVVGPVCESGDFLARDRRVPALARHEIVAVFGAGAYGMSMASRYNSHPLPAEALVEGSSVRVIRERETLADLTDKEREPRWLGS